MARRGTPSPSTSIPRRIRPGPAAIAISSAAVDEMAIAAGPGRMRLGIDVEGEGVPLLAIGGVGLKLSAVRHHHLDAVIVWVEVLKLLHGCLTGWLSHKTSYAQRAKSPAPRAK